MAGGVWASSGPSSDAVMARAIGLVGHILEEIRSPMAIELWQKVEHDVSVPPDQRGKAG